MLRVCRRFCKADPEEDFNGVITDEDKDVTDGTATRDMVYSFVVNHLCWRTHLAGAGKGKAYLDMKTIEVAVESLVDLRTTQLAQESWRFPDFEAKRCAPTQRTHAPTAASS